MSPSAAPATIERLGPDVVADPVAEPEGAPEPSAVVDEAGLHECPAELRRTHHREGAAGHDALL